MLNGGQFIGVVALRPGDNGAGVHGLAMLAVELRGFTAVAVVAEAVGPDLGVLLPEFFIGREGIDQLRPLTLPGGVFVAVENLIGHVAGSNHGAWHDAGDLLARPGEIQDRAVERVHPGPGLRVAARRFIGLRIVQHHQRGPNRPAVGALELHAANAALDTRHADDRAACFTVRNRRKDDLIGCPDDPGMPAIAKLALGPVVDALQGVDGEDRLGIVGQELIVGLELDLDAFEHAAGVTGVRADQADEPSRPGQHRPDAGRLGQRGLAAAARHRHGEQPAAQNGLFDLGDHLQVVVRPRQAERLGEVRFAEEPEVRLGPRLPLGIDYTGNGADVPAGCRQLRAAGSGGFLYRLVVGGLFIRFGIMTQPYQPCGVAEQVHALTVAGGDSKTRPVAMPAQLPLADHLAERRGVQHPRQDRRAKLSGVNRHRPSP